MTAAGSEHVHDAASEVAGVLEPLVDRDWDARAGDLEWSCAATAAHVAHDLLKYATQLAGRAEGSYLRFRVVISDEEQPVEIVRIVRSAAQVLVAVVDAAPDDARAWHYGPADRSGFAAMGVGEMLVHTFDVTSGLGVDWRPPAALAHVVLERLMPDVARDDPSARLLWATGRIDLPGERRASSWVWRAATPLATAPPALS